MILRIRAPLFFVQTPNIDLHLVSAKADTIRALSDLTPTTTTSETEYRYVRFDARTQEHNAW